MSKVILMSGIPGSGKSTIAKRLRNLHLNIGDAVILSTDDFFMVDGEYNWTADFIGYAHDWNKGRFYRHLFLKTDLIIIDNTNLSTWEVSPYVEASIKNGYEWEIIRSDTPWANDPIECSKRNTHGVSQEVCEKMLKRMEPLDKIINSLKEKYEQN